jgi:hypothetical protein
MNTINQFFIFVNGSPNFFTFLPPWMAAFLKISSFMAHNRTVYVSPPKRLGLRNGSGLASLNFHANKSSRSALWQPAAKNRARHHHGRGRRRRGRGQRELHPEAISELCRGKTTLVNARRLNPIRSADKLPASPAAPSPDGRPAYTGLCYGPGIEPTLDQKEGGGVRE